MLNVTGGGPSGQTGAISLGIARSLLKYDESLRETLRANGLLTRDSRMVERKKYGQPGARKQFQFQNDKFIFLIVSSKSTSFLVVLF